MHLTSPTPNRTILASLSVVFARYGTVLVALSMFVTFGLTADRFFHQANILNILQQISIVATVAIGSTMVILVRGIDLSPGSVVLLCGVILGAVLKNNAGSAIAAILLALSASVAVGLINGLLVVKGNISPVIVTLGTMIAIRGLAQILLAWNGSWIWVTNSLLTYVGRGAVGFLPVTVVIMGVVYAVAHVLMTKTAFGRYVYAIGGNELAAKMAGLTVDSTKILVYALAGLFSGLGGILMAARLAMISPAIGGGLEFDAITAVVLGGTSLTGGVGRVEKTLIGAIIVGLILNYLTMIGISASYQRAVTGFLILVAALLDRVTRGRLE